jgi:hypothetical protein
MANHKVTHREQRRWSHWRGTPDDIYKVMEAAQQAIDDTGPPDTPPSGIQLRPAGGSLTYEDREEDLEGLDQIRQSLNAPDLRRFQRLSVFFGSDFHGVQAHVAFDNYMGSSVNAFSVVDLSVYGSDRIKVPGVARAVGNVIDVGKPRFAWAPRFLVPKLEILTDEQPSRIDRLRMGASRWGQLVVGGVGGSIVGGLIVYFLTK